MNISKDLILNTGNLQILLYDTRKSGDSSSRKDSDYSRLLTAAALERYLGHAPSDEDLAGELRLPGQKPCFPQYPDFHYNISHSGGLIVCAVCDHPIGIDLQKIPEDPERAMKIASHFFSAKEQESLLALKRSRDLESLCHLFCRYWTARESYIKLTGRGLGEPFDSYRPDLEAGLIRLADPAEQNGSGRYYITECAAPDGFCMTVCCRVPLHSPEFEQYSFTLE